MLPLQFVSRTGERFTGKPLREMRLMSEQPYTMDQAFNALVALKHWRVQKHNRGGVTSAYECTIWHGGRRVTANVHALRGPAEAVRRALEKLREPRRKSRPSRAANRPQLKIAGES